MKPFAVGYVLTEKDVERIESLRPKTTKQTEQRVNEALSEYLAAQDQSDRSKRVCPNCDGLGFRKDTPEGRACIAKFKRYDRAEDASFERSERTKSALVTWLKSRGLNEVADLVTRL